MIGESIKKLRTENKMTQKELADKLYVTAQAVSRWENGEVEPSVTTVAEIAKIFNVSTDYILGVESAEKDSEKAESTENIQYIYKEPPKPVLAVCEICNKPIYESNQIVRESRNIYSMRKLSGTENHVYCKSCHDEREKRKHEALVDAGIARRKRAFWVGGLAAVALIIIGIVVLAYGYTMPGIYTMIGAIPAFTLVSCLFLQNNFVGDVVGSIFMWGFVKFPGLIFTLDIDGCMWFIAMKIIFWILGALLAVAAGALAIAIGAALSIFVYPFAIHKNFSDPAYAD